MDDFINSYILQIYLYMTIPFLVKFVSFKLSFTQTEYFVLPFWYVLTWLYAITSNKDIWSASVSDQILAHSYFLSPTDKPSHKLNQVCLGRLYCIPNRQLSSLEGRRLPQGPISVFGQPEKCLTSWIIGHSFIMDWPCKSLKHYAKYKICSISSKMCTRFVVSQLLLDSHTLFSHIFQGPDSI